MGRRCNWAMLVQGLICWLFQGGFKVSTGTVQWHRGSCGTDSDHSEIASPPVRS